MNSVFFFLSWSLLRRGFNIDSRTDIRKRGERGVCEAQDNCICPIVGVWNKGGREEGGREKGGERGLT